MAAGAGEGRAAWPRTGCWSCCCRAAAASRSAAARSSRSPPDASRETPRARSCAPSSAPASWTSGIVELETPAAVDADARGLLRAGHGGDGHQPQGHALQHPAEPHQAPAGPGGRGAAAPRPGGGPEAGGHGRGRSPRPSGASRTPASSSWTSWTRSPAGRAAHGPDVSREGVQRDLLPIVEGSTVTTKYGVGADRPRPVHRRRRLPRRQALRPDPRAAGALSDPRRAGALDARGFRPHPDRARERPDPAVRGAAADRAGDTAVHCRRRWRRSPRSPCR